MPPQLSRTLRYPGAAADSRGPAPLQSFHVIKGKTLSKHIINGSGQMPTLCELPDPKVGTWKVTLVVDHKENGKKGAALKVGQNCAVVQVRSQPRALALPSSALALTHARRCLLPSGPRVRGARRQGREGRH